MIDAIATLRPETGLARRWAPAMAHDTLLWTVAVDVGLADHRPTISGGRRFDMVGATAFRRADAMIRAAGEAVERLALVAPADDPCRVRAVPPDHPERLLVGTPRAARTRPGLDGRAVDCLRAVHAATGARVLLPAAVVDDPVVDQPATDVDPTPSSTAAGSSWAQAATNALLESVERDAVQCAWVLGPPLPYLDPGALPAWWPVNPGDPGGREERLLADALRVTGGTARTVLIPTDVAGVTAALTLLFDDGPDGVVSAGASAGFNLRRTVLTSARESVQVMHALGTLLDGRATPPSGEDPIVDEPRRAELWASPRARGIAQDWLAGCVPLEEAEPPTELSPADRLGHLVGQLVAAGLDPILCDLTQRLPARVRQLGWHAARAAVIGHQVLRMAETHEFTWAHDRLRQQAARWRVTVPSRLADRPPHPLI